MTHPMVQVMLSSGYRNGTHTPCVIFSARTTAFAHFRYKTYARSGPAFLSIQCITLEKTISRSTKMDGPI